MKKTRFPAVAALLIALILLLPSCGKKPPTSEGFVSIMESRGFTVRESEITGEKPHNAIYADGENYCVQIL